MGTARKTDDLADLISLREAGELLGVARQSVLTQIVKGDLKAVHIAKRTFVSRESVEQLIASRE